jgi:hypothetical protein
MVTCKMVLYRHDNASVALSSEIKSEETENVSMKNLCGNTCVYVYISLTF